MPPIQYTGGIFEAQVGVEPTFATPLQITVSRTELVTGPFVTAAGFKPTTS